MNPVRTDVRPWFEHALIALLALAVGLSFGLSYGLETHTSYFLYPLREIDPTFLRFDWLAAHTELVHKSFALIIRALSILGPLPWTVAIANVVLVATFILAIYGFLHANFKRDAGRDLSNGFRWEPMSFLLPLGSGQLLFAASWAACYGITVALA